MKKVKINGVSVKVFEKKDLKKLQLNNEQVKLIMQYQKQFPELLQDVEGFVIDSRNLWTQLDEPYGQFNKWADNKIIKKGFINDVDYISMDKIVQRENGGNKSKEYTLTVDCAKNVCMMENTEAGRIVREYFILIEKVMKDWIEWMGEREPQKEGYNLLSATLHSTYKLTHENNEPKTHVYSIEANMLDKALFGRNSKQMKTYLGIESDDALREHLGVEANKALRFLQDYDRELIMALDDYKERKRRIELTCKTRFAYLSTRVEEVKRQLETA